MTKTNLPRQELLKQLCDILTKLKALEAETSVESESLREHRTLFEDLFHNSRQGMVVLQDWVVVRANPTMSRVLGEPLDSLVGSNAKRFFGEKDLPDAIQRYENRLKGISPHEITKRIFTRRDGSKVPVEIDAAKVIFENKDSVLAVITDLTYIEKAEGELLRLRQYQISLVEHVNIWVNILDQEGNVVVWNKAAEDISGYSKEEVIGHSKIWEWLYPDSSYRNEIFSKAMSIIEEGEEARGLETTILTRSGKNKVLSWYSRDLFDEEGNQIGSIAIGLNITQIREANEALERSNHALRTAYDQNIEGWSRALDLRDKETEGHSIRVTDITIELAKLAGMNEEELINIRRGALLHDIGKLGIPDSVLLKPGKLTKDERALIEKHTEYANIFLNPIEYLRPALAIPLHHHERWDGSGYPQGLKGEDIPLSARLFAVADVWDALRSDRPYRKAWSEARTLDFIKSKAGIEFDPQAVLLFLQLISKTRPSNSMD